MPRKAAAFTLYLTVAVLLVRNCSSQCRDVTTAIIIEESNHTIQVSGTFEDSTLTLHCGITDGELLYGQQLIWSEGGVEIKDSLDSQYQVTSTSSVLTFPNASDYRYGEYSCRCHNRFNYTVDTIEALIHNTSNAFSPYCSKPATTVVHAPHTVQEINDSWIVYHKVQTPGERISISCSNGTAMLYSPIDDTVSIWEEPMYIVESPAYQAKFVCVEEEEILQVHYVLIKGYFPLEFILPTAGAREVFAVPSQDSVLCAVVSHVAPSSLTLTYTLLIGFDPMSIGTVASYGHLHAIHAEVEAVALEYNCLAVTAWDNVNVSYTITTRPKNTQSTGSSLYFAVFAYVLNNTVRVGETTSVVCRVISSTLGHANVSVKFNDSVYDVELQNEILHTTEYRFVVDDTSEKGYREYVCIAEISEGCRDTHVTYLNVTDSANDDYEYYESYEVSSSIEASSTHISSSVISASYTTSNIISSAYTSSSRSDIASQPSAPTSSNTISSRPTMSSSSNSSDTTIAGPSTTIVSSSNNNRVPASLPSTDTITTIVASVVFALVMAVFLVFLATLALLCCCRWNRSRLTHGQMHQDNDCMSDFDSVSISISTSFPSLLHSPSLPSKATTKFIQNLTLSKWYIPYNKLQVHEVLGSGAFGIVRRATLEQQGTVAVKMLKAYATEEEQRDIITEFNMLQRVGTHKNIVNLIGASSYKGRLAIIVEYCPGGSLLSYLRRSRTNSEALSLNRQLNMALQVAEGMEYLASNKCVHRDLATRNVLITEEGTLKVADFGLARETYHSVYTKSSKGKIPYKWMSPESLFDNEYTMKSDVWSFGVLLWEISTKGLSPYPGKTVPQLLEDMRGQKVMEQHAECSIQLYELMLQCWKYDPNERPSFTELVRITQSQVTDRTHCVCELDKKKSSSTDNSSYSEDNETNTDSSIPSTDSTSTSLKFHHQVKTLSSSSAEVTTDTKQDYYYRSSSCMSDSSGGYLQFEEEESSYSHEAKTKVYKTRNGSCSVTLVRAGGGDADDSDIALQDMDTKHTPPQHTLYSNTHMVGGIA